MNTQPTVRKPIVHEKEFRTVDASRPLAEVLTQREIEIAELVALSNRDIGLALGISWRTAHAHLQNIKRKTGLETRASIAVAIDREFRQIA